MIQPGFLIDENLPPMIAVQLRRHAAGIPILAINEVGAPPKGTKDPIILDWLESHNYRLITNNRTSMPEHLRDHLKKGHHIPGILITPHPLNVGGLIEELILIWGASLPDEYQDQILYLPLSS